MADGLLGFTNICPVGLSPYTSDGTMRSTFQKATALGEQETHRGDLDLAPNLEMGPAEFSLNSPNPG